MVKIFWPIVDSLAIIRSFIFRIFQVVLNQLSWWITENLKSLSWLVFSASENLRSSGLGVLFAGYKFNDTSSCILARWSIGPFHLHVFCFLPWNKALSLVSLESQRSILSSWWTLRKKSNDYRYWFMCLSKFMHFGDLPYLRYKSESCSYIYLKG